NANGIADSNAATLTVNAGGPPAAPAALTAIPAGFTKVRLRWSAATGATSYVVKRSTTVAAEVPIASGVIGTTFTDTTAVKGQFYYYVVSAVSGAGESGNSSEVVGSPLFRAAALDFDGDGRSDLTYFRVAGGAATWNTQPSSAGFAAPTSVPWGLP